MVESEFDVATRRLALYVIRERLADTLQFPPSSHLTADEVGVILAGSTLPAELARLEGHLSACESCGGLLRGLQEAERKGLQPQFLPRRPSIRTAEQRLTTRLTRRYSPIVVALIVFVLATAIPISQGWLTGKGELTLRELALVVDHVGTPVVRVQNDAVSPAETGGWLMADQAIVLEAGDSLRVLNSKGELGSVSRGGVEWEGKASSVLAGLFRWRRSNARKSRVVRQRVDAELDPQNSGVRWLHPIGQVYSRRPAFRWIGTDSHVQGKLRVEAHLLEGGVSQQRSSPLVVASVSGRSCRFPGGDLDLAEGGRFMARLEIVGESSELTVRFHVASRELRQSMKRDLAEIATHGGRAVRYLRAEYLMSQRCLSEAREEIERLRIGNERNLHLIGRLLVVCEHLHLVHEVAALSALMVK